MYINSGYLHNSLVDFKDKSRPLVVGSCGTYKLRHISSEKPSQAAHIQTPRPG